MADASVEVKEAPGNYSQWHKSSHATMDLSRRQASEILTRLQQYEAAEAAKKAATQEAEAREREAVKDAAKRRVKAHIKVINSSQASIKVIEDAICKLEATLTQLTHERYARFADSQVATRRAEMRDKRPQQETFKDNLHLNLELEKSTCAKYRKELLEREKEVSDFLEKLAVMRKELSRDTGTRRLQVEHEYSNLKPVFAPPLKSQDGEPSVGDGSLDGTLSPASPSSSKGEKTPAGGDKAAHGVDHHAEPLPPDKIADFTLTNRTMELVADVDSFIDRSRDTIRRSNSDSHAATCSVTKSLSRRSIELANVKKTLEAHILDTSHAIGEAERSVNKQEKRLNKKNAAEVQRLDATKALLDSLKNTKAKLQDDLRGKIAALDIDNACRRVTPQIAAEKKKRPASSSGMKKSESAPNFAGIGEQTLKPQSPIGGSTALKGAAAATLGTPINNPAA